MSWHPVGKPKSAKLTKALAVAWSSLPHVPHDRPLSERRIESYLQAVEKGEFRSATWAKCFCSEDKTTYRVNGNHTSTMFANYQGTLPDISITLENYTAETLQDVSRLYATFDPRIQGRTTADINRTFAASNPELATIQSNIINCIVSGLSYALWQDHGYSRQPVDRATLILENVPFALWYKGLLKTVHPSILFRSPVVGAMYNTWMKSHKDANTFWNAVQDETGESRDLPDRVLSRWLLVNSVSKTKNQNYISTRKAPAREFYVRCLHAWNAWRKGEKTQLRYVPDAPLPKVL